MLPTISGISTHGIFRVHARWQIISLTFTVFYIVSYHVLSRFYTSSAGSRLNHIIAWKYSFLSFNYFSLDKPHPINSIFWTTIPARSDKYVALLHCSLYTFGTALPWTLQHNLFTLWIRNYQRFLRLTHSRHRLGVSCDRRDGGFALEMDKLLVRWGTSISLRLILVLNTGSHSADQGWLRKWLIIPANYLLAVSVISTLTPITSDITSVIIMTLIDDWWLTDSVIDMSTSTIDRYQKQTRKLQAELVSSRDWISNWVIRLTWLWLPKLMNYEMNTAINCSMIVDISYYSLSHRYSTDYSTSNSSSTTQLVFPCSVLVPCTSSDWGLTYKTMHSLHTMYNTQQFTDNLVVTYWVKGIFMAMSIG